MNLWPFARKELKQAEAVQEPSTLERLLTRDCSRDEFFLLYSKLVQERIPHSTIEFSDDSVLRIVGPDKKEATAYLENLWLKYRSGDEDRLELIEKYIRLAQDLLKDSSPPERQNIVPTIKDSQYMESLQPRTKFMTEHLCGDLWIVYAEDQPERIATVMRDSALAVGITESEIRSLALENLTRILPQAECHGDGPWYLMTAGKDYVASLILIDSIWEQVESMVDGDVVAAVPSRDVLIFTGSESTEGISAIGKRSREICDSGTHVISNTLIIRRNGSWSVFNAN